jgi:hypothetical protein
MQLKPKPPTFRSMMLGLAIVFGGYGGMMLYHHDRNNGLWSCAWSGPLGLWIALLVTGMIPPGFLAPFLALMVKLKQASQGLR